ncbi:MAG: aldehyde dehydrogenase family protein [Oligoflexia bacterium]|nr:aldehyde dehydrogenase family protein [Oligoflexia bacterium]
MSNICIVRKPYDGSELGRIPFESEAEISDALDLAVKAFEKWRHSSSHERSQLLLSVAARLEARRQEFAMLIRDEAGKPIALAEAEVLRALGVLRWAAAETLRSAGELLRLDVVGSGRPGYGLATRFPRGPILGITPFNFPLNLLVHKLAPAIASGNSILIKPSPFTPLTAQRFVSIFHEVGAIEGLAEIVMADDAATEKLTRAPAIAMVSFTGSARVGKLIQAQAVGKPVTLELGGNAWVAVLEDTPESAYPAIARKITGGAFGYAGQSCISVQNVALPHSIADAFTAALKRATEETLYGNPNDPNVVSGPLINDAAAVRIENELKKVANDCEMIQSKKLSGDSGPNSRMVPPTLLCLKKDPAWLAQATIIQEEIFGPVMTVSRFADASELIDRINSSRYGLQAGIFTQRWDLIERFYKDLQVGGLVINDAPTTRYDHQPYGGEKDSGTGREGVQYAMEEMTTVKFLGLSSQLPS